MDVTVKKWFKFDIKFLIFSTWSRCGIYVVKKYRVSTTNVPIFIEIRSGDKIRSIIFERSYGLQTVKLPRWRKTRIGCDWQSQFISRKTNLDHNKCIKIEMKMKKVNKQCLLDTPRTVRVSEKTWQVIVQTRRP